VIDYGQTMTVSGTINKSFIMLLLLVASASVTWWMTYAGYNPMVFTIGGAIVAFILVLISVLNLNIHPILRQVMHCLKDYLLEEFRLFLKPCILEL
jgi:uncharacterized YccA/Bax inhibitor family protein